MLSKFGGLGGLVGAQLGLGNTNLDKTEIILKGHELAEYVIKKHDLMPKLFPALWDSSHGSWNVEDSSLVPPLREGIEVIRFKVLSVLLDRKREFIRIGANSHNPVYARNFVQYYMDALNMKLLSDVKKEAAINREYLEKQYNNTSDPVIKDKISNLIALEMEKRMLVSSTSFDVLEKPLVSFTRKGPNKKKMVVLSFVFGLFVSIALIFTIQFLSMLGVKLKQS